MKGQKSCNPGETETVSNNTPKKHNIAVGLNMFGVIKIRKSRTLAYEQVFMLNTSAPQYFIATQPTFVKRKETKPKKITKSSNSTPKTPKTVNYSSSYCSSAAIQAKSPMLNNANDATKILHVQIVEPASPQVSNVSNDHQPKRERRMLSLQELLN